MDNEAIDRPLSEDIAEQKREVQREVDNNIRLRAELDQSNQRLDAMDQMIADGAADAREYLRQYRNPTQENPATPIAPDVAAPAPAEEPPVFTSVDTPELSPDSTSGGFAPTIADELVVVSPDDAAAANDDAAG